MISGRFQVLFPQGRSVVHVDFTKSRIGSGRFFRIWHERFRTSQSSKLTTHAIAD